MEFSTTVSSPFAMPTRPSNPVPRTPAVAATIAAASPPRSQPIPVPRFSSDDEPEMPPMLRSESVSQGLLNRGTSNLNLATNRRPVTGRPSFSSEIGSGASNGGAEDEMTRALIEAERDVLEWRHNFRQTTGRYPVYKDIIEDRAGKKENVRTKLKAYRDLRRKKLANSKPF